MQTLRIARIGTKAMTDRYAHQSSRSAEVCSATGNDPKRSWDMAREFDPNNLSGGDVFRAIAPVVGFIVALIVAASFGPAYVAGVIVISVGLVIYSVRSMPKKDLQAIVKADQRINDRIKNLPVLGPILYPLWRVLGWAHNLFTLAIIILLLYLALNWATG